MSGSLDFKSNNATVNEAFRIAIGDVATNTKPFKHGAMPEEGDCAMAGLDYDFPWTRDAAINNWYGLSLMRPEVGKNTLLSMLEEVDGKWMINLHQYWDAIIWAHGLWQYFLYTGDREMLEIGLEPIKRTLAFLERTEQSPEYDGLFRGGACTADGTSAYDDLYIINGGESTGIFDWAKFNPDKKHPVGDGVPMHALSSNCLYYQAYRVVSLIQEELGLAVEPVYLQKAADLKDAINQHFWLEDKGFYKIFVDPLAGDSDRQDVMGLGLAIVFGIADEAKAERVLDAMHKCPAGYPTGWPDYPRYSNIAGDHYGRHSACVWPPFEAPFIRAGADHGREDILMHFIDTISKFACRDLQFAEVFHPMTGEIYGGIQEVLGNLEYVWGSTRRQTWSATSFIFMLLTGVCGMKINRDGIDFRPILSENLGDIEVKNIRYRDMILDLEIKGSGMEIKRFSIDGTPSEKSFLPAAGCGRTRVVIEVE